MDGGTSRPVLSLADLEAFDPSASERGRERRFCCPLPGCADKRRDGRHRSLSLNVDRRWHCHRCGAGGLLRERWPRREPGFNPRRASSRRAFALHEDSRSVSEPTYSSEAKAPTPNSAPAGEGRWRATLNAAPPVARDDPGAEYLASRGIDLVVARACGARYSKKLAPLGADRVPAGGRCAPRVDVSSFRSCGRELVAIQGRAISPSEYGPKVITRGDLGAGVFCTSLQALQAETLVIVEAPIDALSLATAGCQAIAVCGTSIPQWLPPLLVFRNVLLGFDADEAGDRVSARAAEEFSSYGCTVERWRPALKDWNEVLVAGGLEELCHTVRADLESQ